MTAPSRTTADHGSARPPRVAVIGLGMIGRHHARLQQSLASVDFVGAVDPSGDRFEVINDAARLYDSVDALLAATPLDCAVVSVPTVEHLPMVRALAAAGVHVLVEKPLAGTSEQAREIIAVCHEAGVRGAVGHVERFNPALVALRERLLAGQLGEVFMIATERLGPFPARINDVGVVKDLATHDLDLVRWLGGAPVELLSAQTQHRMGRHHEDLVLVNGRLASGTAFACSVDWLTPTKTRRTRVLGERGMLVADTLTAELTFFANGHVASEWDSNQQLKGVTEGDATRYALAWREPLRVELETFVDLATGDLDAPVVSLEAGLEAVICAEAVLESASRGETVRPSISPESLAL